MKNRLDYTNANKKQCSSKHDQKWLVPTIHFMEITIITLLTHGETLYKVLILFVKCDFDKISNGDSIKYGSIAFPSRNMQNKLLKIATGSIAENYKTIVPSIEIVQMRLNDFRPNPGT